MESGKLLKLDLKSLPDPGNKFKLGLKIGGGVGGEVIEAVDSETGRKVAIKIIELKKETEEEVKQEYQVLKLLSGNEYFPEFYGIYSKKERDSIQKIWLVMEFCEGGTAKDFARKIDQKNKKMNELHIAYIIRETIKAVIHLHDNEICHRDVQGSNILLTADGKVKLVDYGISKRVNKNEKMKTFVGSPSWLAPEVIARKGDESDGYDKKADVWAIGITAIELGDGQAPFEDIHPGRALFQIIQNPPPTLRKPSEWSQLYNDFISECLVKDPENRPFVQELLEHTFFKPVDTSEDLQNEIKAILDSQKNTNLYKKPDVQIKKGYMRIEQKLSPEKILQEDLAALTDVSEDSVLHELYERFKSNEFYTFVGDILLALNPNKAVDIYGTEFHKKYRFKNKSQNAPHVYSVADSAYRDVFHHEKPQHILFAGETGAGKTVNMMHATDHLLFLGQGLKCSEKVKKALNVIQTIGNASTPHNGNSTRHVLQTQLTFTDTGKVSGAVFRLYQLEKERMTTTSKNQSNFHLFYYFYETIKAENGLPGFGKDKDRLYKFLKLGLDTDKERNSKENIKKYKLFEENLRDLEFEEEQIESIKNILAAILLIGEIEFINDEDGNGVLTTPDIVNDVADLLGVETKKLSWALLKYCLIMKGEAIMRHNSKEEADEAKDVLAKGIYLRLVDWIVNTINEKLSVPRFIYGDRHIISLMDLFGFECYKKNTLSQLFVNTLNEQLHFHYNQKIFAWEKKTAEEEGIPFPKIEFKNNTEIIDLIMSKPDGLLQKIDEATRSEDLSDIIGSLPDSKTAPIFAETSQMFSINHYTGKLTYDATEMPEKNKDFLPPELIDTMRLSTKKVTKQLFSALLTRSGNLSTQASVDENQEKKKKDNRVNTNLPGQFSQSRQMRTTAATFRATSIAILKALTSNDFGCHFVRCIRTDLSNKPNDFHPEVVRQQMRALGIVNTVLTTQQGYSYSVQHNEFIRRYKFLAFDFDENVEETKENCRLLLLRLKLEGWTMGKSKVFLKYYNKEYLSRLYETQIRKIVKVQSMMRAYMARRKLYAKIRKYQDDADKCKLIKEEENGQSLEYIKAATIIQKKFREYSGNNKKSSDEITDELDEATKTFIKPWCKRWKAKSIFQVLLLYRAERLQTLVNFCLQIHLFNQNTINSLQKTNYTVSSEEIISDVTVSQYLPPLKPSTHKLPFMWEAFIQKGDSTQCEPLPDCNLEKLESEVMANLKEMSEIASKPDSTVENSKIFEDKEVQTALAESVTEKSCTIDCELEETTTSEEKVEANHIQNYTQENQKTNSDDNQACDEDEISKLNEILERLTKEELPSKSFEENELEQGPELEPKNEETIGVLENVKLTENPTEKNSEAKELEETNSMKVEVSQKNLGPKISSEKKNSLTQITEEYSKPKNIPEIIKENHKQPKGQNQDFRKKSFDSQEFIGKPRANFGVSLKELEEKFKETTHEENEEPPFNFRAMLRKTNYSTCPTKNENIIFQSENPNCPEERRGSLNYMKLKKFRRPSETIVTELAPGILVHGKISDL